MSGFEALHTPALGFDHVAQTLMTFLLHAWHVAQGTLLCHALPPLTMTLHIAC